MRLIFSDIMPMHRIRTQKCSCSNKLIVNGISVWNHPPLRERPLPLRKIPQSSAFVQAWLLLEHIRKVVKIDYRGNAESRS